MPIATRAKVGIVGAVFAGMVGVAAFGAYNVYTGLEGGNTGSGTSARVGAPAGTGAPADASTGDSPLTRKEITDTAGKFLSAWSAGDTARAAALTDSVRSATDALAGYASEGHIGSVAITPGAATSDGERFTVTAHIAYERLTSAWRYDSSLTVTRNAAGDPAVAWAPSVLNPALGEGDTLVTGQSDTPDVEVTDRDGGVLTGARYPSLTRIIADLKTRYGDRLPGGTPGIQTQVRNADGSNGRILHVLRQGTAKSLKTTLDPGLQAAAERAVAGHAEAGVTAVDTTSGSILAVAYSPVDGPDVALMEDSAPGSTFKIVTAAALLRAGLTPSSPAPCYSQDNSGNGRMYHNDTATLHNSGASLAWDFAQSCNTGFVRQASRLGPGGLRDTAALFGLTQEWQVGTPTADNQPNMPSTGEPDELTSEMIGQGQLRMSPLVMASVAATAATGHFRQPLIVDKGLVEGDVATAPDLSPGISRELRQMMRGAVTNGTASQVMSGFGPDSGAKTGSAEVAGQGATNGWFTAYCGHVAAAAVVHDAGHGNATAGPIVADVLRAS